MMLKLTFRISNAIDVYCNGFITVEIIGAVTMMVTVEWVTALKKNLLIVLMSESQVMPRKRHRQHPLLRAQQVQPAQYKVQPQQVPLQQPQHVMGIPVFHRKNSFPFHMHSIRVLSL